VQLDKAVFLDLASIHPDDLDLSPLHDVIPGWQWHDNTAAGDVVSAIEDAEVVVVNKVVLDEDILASSTSLKLVCAAATGSSRNTT